MTAWWLYGDGVKMLHYCVFTLAHPGVEHIKLYGKRSRFKSIQAYVQTSQYFESSVIHVNGHEVQTRHVQETLRRKQRKTFNLYLTCFYCDHEKRCALIIKRDKAWYFDPTSFHVILHKWKILSQSPMLTQHPLIYNPLFPHQSHPIFQTSRYIQPIIALNPISVIIWQRDPPHPRPTVFSLPF